MPTITPIPNNPRPVQSALDRGRRKAYLRLLPLLGACYSIAYVDRANVAIAKLTMSKALPAFDNAVIGLGAGLFFVGYFLLEIPGSLLVEKWSARKWICRIMVTWGVVASLTALVKTPHQFYLVRSLLGLAEAGFFPGVIVYLTHWFSGRDRARALACFIIATPVAQIVSPKISNALLKIGADEALNGVSVHHAELFGLQGWQVMYIFWGIPAVLLGLLVLFALKDRPRDAGWLTHEERQALEENLAADQARRAASRRMHPSGTNWSAMDASLERFVGMGITWALLESFPASRDSKSGCNDHLTIGPAWLHSSLARQYGLAERARTRK